MATTEHLVLPLTPEGWPTGYTMEQLTLQHLEDTSREWIILVYDPMTERPPGASDVSAPLAEAHGLHPLIVAADGYVYKYTDGAHTCLRLHRVRFDAGRVHTQMAITPANRHKLVPGTVVSQSFRLSELKLFRAAADGGWNVISLVEAHHQRMQGTIVPYLSNTTHVQCIHFLEVLARDDYVLK